MTARNRDDRSDSDTTRKIQVEAAIVCARKNSRIWWALAILFSLICSIAGAGATIAINDHATLMASEQKINANDRRISEIGITLNRMDDKLDRLLREMNGIRK